MKRSLVSIIMPAYNHAKYIRQALDSAVNQTYANIEIIVSDNGSTDGTAEIIRSYTDSRIRKHFFDVNTGATNNSDFCLSKARGKYIAFLFTDDFWDVNKIEKQVACMEENTALAAVFTHVHLVNDEGTCGGLENHPLKNTFEQENRSRAEWLRAFFFYGNLLCCPSVLINREIFTQLDYSSSDGLSQLVDFNWWVQMVKRYPFYIIQEKLTYNRVRNDGGNMSAVNNETYLRTCNETRLIFSEFFEDMPDALCVEAFAPYFKKAGPLTREQLVCEQAFLFLLENKTVQTKVIAAEKLYTLLKNPVYRNILQNDYGFTLEDYHRLTVSYIYIETNKKERDERYARAEGYLDNAENRVAVIVVKPDLDANKSFLHYLLNKGAIGKLACIICEPAECRFEYFKDVPVCNIQDALVKYPLNTIVIDDVNYQDALYEILQPMAEQGIKLVKI